MSDRDAKVRQQRDRFLAFAFAGADVLLEVDEKNRIVFCAGTSEHVFAQSSARLTGCELGIQFVDNHARILTEALIRLRKLGRLSDVHLTARAGKHAVPVVLSGIKLPEMDGLVHLCISRSHSAVRPPAAAAESAQGENPKEAFLSIVEQRLNESRQSGEDVALTLLELGADKLENVEKAQLNSFLDNVEDYLKAWSIGGDSVGRLEDGKFGIVHGDDVAGDALRKRISDIAHEVLPGTEIDIAAATVDVSAQDLTSGDMTKALVYTINRFVSEGGEKMQLSTLAEGYKAAVADTLAKVGAFRNTINSERFVFVFQPIVNLRTNTVHHYEALARISKGEQIVLPSFFIGFAEDVGVVTEMDFVACRRAVAVLKENKLLRESDSIAVNLSGLSITNLNFIAELRALLLDNKSLLPRLMFEVTESAEIKDLGEANQAIQAIRGMGCPVCLDDFGAGAAAFQYLRALDVDYVKIDGSYIKQAFDDRLGKPFLKAMAGLCHDLNIKTIGEMVEDRKSATLLQGIEIDYAQGYFFARPMRDVSGFVLSAPATSPPDSGAMLNRRLAKS